MDWDPSAQSRPPAPSASTGPAGASSSGASSAGTGSAGTGSRGAGGSAAPSRAGSSLVGSVPAGSDAGTGAHGNGNGNGQPHADPASVSGTPHDPWTRAIEQAPGVWVVGKESNVGRSVSAGGPEETPNPPAPTPHYEPAAAQVPPSIPVTKAGSSPGPDWGLAPSAPSPGSGRPGNGDYGQAPASTHPVREPEYAMASASSAAADSSVHAAHAPSAPMPTAPSPTAPVSQAASVATVPAQAAPKKADTAQPAQSTSAAAAEARQSLYQRLSNSPEAEAGRAKAPARAVAAATYVQDIPSADDETIEESGVFGRAAVERILGGKLIEERTPDGSPITPRY